MLICPECGHTEIEAELVLYERQTGEVAFEDYETYRPRNSDKKVTLKRAMTACYGNFDRDRYIRKERFFCRDCYTLIPESPHYEAAKLELNEIRRRHTAGQTHQSSTDAMLDVHTKALLHAFTLIHELQAQLGQSGLSPAIYQER